MSVIQSNVYIPNSFNESNQFHTDIEVKGLKMVDQHHDNNRNPNDWLCAVFPPINHENLSNQDTPQSPSPPPSSSSSSSCLSCDSESWVDPHVRKGGDFAGWVSFGIQFLRSRLSSFWNREAFRWLPAAAAVVFSCWILVIMAKINRRKRSLTRSETRLMNIIKEKDGRIAQLLDQIAQMNEILIARHKALAAKVVE